MWSVVEFEDAVQLVPHDWLNKGKGESYWPPFTNSTKINKCIKDLAEADENWPTHKIKRIFCNTDSYETGRKKMKLAETQSDLETEDDEISKRKRKENAKKTYSDTSDDESPSIVNSALPKTQSVPLPVPPFQSSTNSTDSALQKTQSVLLPKPSVPPSHQSFTSGTDSASPKTVRVLLPKLPVPPPSTSSVTDSSQMKTTSTFKRIPEQEFQRLVLKKLNTVITDMRNCSNRLHRLEQQFVKGIETTDRPTAVADDVFEDNCLGLPLANEEQLQLFENKLSEKKFFFKVVTSLKLLGGIDTHQTLGNIMKTVMENKLAETYSFLGAKKKLGFKKLTLYKVVLATMRARFPTLTEVDLGEGIAKWLVGAKLRATREQLKKQKDEAKTSRNESTQNLFGDEQEMQFYA